MGVKLVAGTSAVVAALVVCGGAFATPPSRSPAQLPDVIDLAGACAFDVVATIDRQNQSAITFASGKTMVGGQLQATLTSASGSIRLSVPGPTRLAPGSGTFVFTGPTLLAAPGFLYYVTGRGTYELDANGFPTNIEQQGGEFVDLCAALS